MISSNAAWKAYDVVKLGRVRQPLQLLIREEGKHGCDVRTMIRNRLCLGETERASLSSAVTAASERYMKRPSAIHTVGTFGSNPAAMRRFVQPSDPRSTSQVVYVAARRGYFAPTLHTSTDITKYAPTYAPTKVGASVARIRILEIAMC